MREQLYELETLSGKDHKVVQDLKRKMHANWYHRIPSLGIHYLATLLDPSLKYLESLEDYFKAYEGSVLDFVQNMLSELGIKLSDLYQNKHAPDLPSKSADGPGTSTIQTIADTTPIPPSPDTNTTPEVQIINSQDITPALFQLKRPLTKKESADLEAKKRRLGRSGIIQ